MKIERIKLDALTCDPANARKHDQRNLDAIKGSLQRFGQQHPIIVDAAGVIRVGNGRYIAMRALGWSECDIVRSNLKGSEATAFAIADNRTAELAGWDDEALAQQLAALQIEDEALALSTGFDDADLRALTEAYGKAEQKLESSAKEIDVDGFSMQCKCPRCGFEFDPKT